MKIVVFDDDPTGSQSVYGCPLLLNWDEDSLLEGLGHKSSLLFILANTRAMSEEGAELITKEICRIFKKVCKKIALDFDDILFVSRGDSTLRGHGVLEPKIIDEELGPFDATFHIPAFFDGGRTTINSLHLLEGCPVHLTNFASDKIFGYSTSFLPDWLEQKSKGKISSDQVIRVLKVQLELAMSSDKGMEDLINFLKDLSENVSVVVDADQPCQLEIFGKAIIQLMGKKRFLFRSAASMISAFANLPKNISTPSILSSLRLRDHQSFELKKGLIMVGSHVKLADEQLEILLKENNCVGVELPVGKILQACDEANPIISLKDIELIWRDRLKKILELNKTPVLYTSRREINFSSVSKRISFGLQLSELMARMVGQLMPHLGYVISKGGITTQLFLTKGLSLSMVDLKGQILPGLSLVCPYDNFNNIPIITFPGNLGDKYTLLNAWNLMEKNN